MINRLIMQLIFTTLVLISIGYAAQDSAAQNSVVVIPMGSALERQIIKNSTLIDIATTSSLVATCPENMVLLAGGIAQVDSLGNVSDFAYDDNLRVAASHPLQNSEAWRGVVENTTSNVHYFDVYAICAREI